MGCVESRQQTYDPMGDRPSEVPVVKLCAPGKDATNFADIGDKVVVFVDFGPTWKPCRLRNARGNNRLQKVQAAAAAAMPYQTDGGQQRYIEQEIMVAGKMAELKLLHPADQQSKTYKAEVKIPADGNYTEGACIPVRLPYCDENDQAYGEISENKINASYAVYFQSLWSQLKVHNVRSHAESVTRSSSNMGAIGYGSMAGRQGVHSGEDEADYVPSVEIEANRRELLQRAENRAPKRYWPDTWEMKCWRSCCDSILRSNKPIPRFIARLFVAPLTNVTGLSLHYQLYLNEIFHTKFLTKLGHYLFMPLVVLTMLTAFAQFRFDQPCYELSNFQVLIPNGAAVVATVFLVWYLIWGLLQKTPLMGVFMMLPLLIIYILANIYFQLAVKNSSGDLYTPDQCWNNTQLHTYLYFYNSFELIAWYYNPILWLVVFSACQAFAHIFEPNIPPRVNQTAHWMGCTDMFKKYGCTKTLWLLFLQAIFGTVDECLASPRLLPLLILKVCYMLGYQRKEWKWMKKLVKKCMEYGDPALDYIGTGGAQYIPEGSTIHDKDTYIEHLKKEVSSMEHALTERQKDLLANPRRLKNFKEEGREDPFLEHYIVLRHYVAQYTLQVYAYGPFRTQHDDDHAVIDNVRMHRDFGHSSSFINFLNQVRFGLWMMEDDLIERRAISRCCQFCPEP